MSAKKALKDPELRSIHLAKELQNLEMLQAGAFAPGHAKPVCSLLPEDPLQGPGYHLEASYSFVGQDGGAAAGFSSSLPFDFPFPAFDVFLPF